MLKWCGFFSFFSGLLAVDRSTFIFFLPALLFALHWAFGGTGSREASGYHQPTSSNHFFRNRPPHPASIHLPRVSQPPNSSPPGISPVIPSPPPPVTAILSTTSTSTTSNSPSTPILHYYIHPRSSAHLPSQPCITTAKYTISSAHHLSPYSATQKKPSLPPKGWI